MSLSPPVANYWLDQASMIGRHRGQSLRITRAVKYPTDMAWGGWRQAHMKSVIQQSGSSLRGASHKPTFHSGLYSPGTAPASGMIACFSPVLVSGSDPDIIGSSVMGLMFPIYVPLQIACLLTTVELWVKDAHALQGLPGASKLRRVECYMQLSDKESEKQITCLKEGYLKENAQDRNEVWVCWCCIRPNVKATGDRLSCPEASYEGSSVIVSQ